MRGWSSAKVNTSESETLEGLAKGVVQDALHASGLKVRSLLSIAIDGQQSVYYIIFLSVLGECISIKQLLIYRWRISEGCMWAICFRAGSTLSTRYTIGQIGNHDEIFIACMRSEARGGRRLAVSHDPCLLHTSGV